MLVVCESIAGRRRPDHCELREEWRVAGDGQWRCGVHARVVDELDVNDKLDVDQCERRFVGFIHDDGNDRQQRRVDHDDDDNDQLRWVNHAYDNDVADS